MWELLTAIGEIDWREVGKMLPRWAWMGCSTMMLLIIAALTLLIIDGV